MIEKKKYNSTAKEIEKAVLVALTTAKQTPEQTKEYLVELEFLATTSGIKTIKTFTQRLDTPHPKTFFGKGKLEEIAKYIEANPVQYVIFDDDLSPSQTKNLEQVFNCNIMDRSLLILNIFALRAQTAQAKTQVELAQYQYVLPRLIGLWSHLTRQKGGGAGMRGPGEKELETDKRIVNDRIAFLKEKLLIIEKQSETRRKSRGNTVRVALVGYTNVGKSTLMNMLSKSTVFAENKLFATVDATVRKMVINNIPFLLTDTVGFIRKLPTTLIECFKSTLDEIREADILLHVVDISHKSFFEQIQVVNDTLKEIKVENKKTILVFNKIDAFKEQQALENGEDSPHFDLEELSKTYLSKSADKVVFVSATKKENIAELRQMIVELVAEKFYEIFPNSIPEEVSWENWENDSQNEDTK